LPPLNAAKAPGGVPSGAPGSAPLWRLIDQTADAVQAVRAGQSLTAVLPKVPADLRPGVQALSFHTLRWLGSAIELRSLLAAKAPPPAVDAVLVVALALLWPGEPAPYAEHTLVDQAVGAVRQRVPAAAGFVNAVLRRFLREREALVVAVQHAPVGAYNHPLWWIERLKRDWPQDWQRLLAGANLRPPMTLRVNARRSSGSAYVQRLAAGGRAASLLGAAALGGERSACVVLAEPCPVQALPGFAEGEVSVQDAAAQRAAWLLLGTPGSGVAPLAAGARVLDACAAPGGKTAHLLELAAPELLALDSDPLRLARVQETLNRLRLPAVAATAPGTLTAAGATVAAVLAAAGAVALKAADARQTRIWWDGRPFDAILLDAPCTASGIVRRHPDIRWLRRADDVGTLACVQAELLDALWPLLKPGGRLLFATCSVFRAEGQDQIDAFLQRLPAGSARLDPASPGHLLPSRDNPGQEASSSSPAPPDGFFYALIHKH
jgi:16S rRNA (cytosine967-C5)-methyltransferase